MQNMAYSSAQLIEIAGVSRSMLNRWLSLEVLQPSVRVSTGKGVDHLFDVADLVQATALGNLSAVGCPIGVAAAAARHVAEATIPDNLDDEGAPDDFVLVFPDGEFAVSSALAERLRTAPAATIILRLRDIQRSVMVGVIEAAFRDRPRRGRKPGQQTQRRGAVSEKGKRPTLDVVMKRGGIAEAPTNPRKARPRTKRHPAKKATATAGNKKSAVSKSANGKRIDVAAKRVKAQPRSRRAPSAGADPIQDNSFSRSWFTRREKQLPERTTRVGIVIRERTQQRRRARRARTRRGRRTHKPRRARIGSDDADPEPARWSAFYKKSLPTRHKILVELSVDASRPPFRGGRG